MKDLTRRRFIQNALAGAAGLAGASLISCGRNESAGLQQLSGDQVLNRELNIYHPKDCQLRIVAQSSLPPVTGKDYLWHAAPDGGACFATEDGGWIYVSNCELPDLVDRRLGGVSALRFDAKGNVVDAYSILEGTRRNCAGGETPWATWLSCEEYGDEGQVYECDPFGKKAPRVLPAMGAFNHEAVAYDVDSYTFYLTEDMGDGCLYRFRAKTPDDLLTGELEVGVQASANRLSWEKVPDPSAKNQPCRYQVKNAATFKGGEGLATKDGVMYFATKIDNRVWAYDTVTEKYRVIYDAKSVREPILTGVDNVEIAPNGDILVAEDQGNMQIVVLDTHNNIFPLITIIGQDRSEICGPAYSPDGTRLYFSSQRGKTGRSRDGITYELQFPFAV